MDRGKNVHQKYAFSLALLHHHGVLLKEEEYGYKQILRAFPNNAAAHYNLGHTLQNQGKRQKSLHDNILEIYLIDVDQNDSVGDKKPKKKKVSNIYYVI